MRTDGHLMEDHGKVRLVIEYDMRRMVILHWNRERHLWEEMRSVYFSDGRFKRVRKVLGINNYKELITPNHRN